jgi:hypothetical protein
VPPEVNVPVDALPRHGTGHASVQRQMIFEYAGTGSNHRMVQLTVKPESSFRFVAGALTEFWVRGGLAVVNGQSVHADCFVVCEEGAEVDLQSPYGVLLIAWAEGRERGGDGNLFGF